MADRDSPSLGSRADEHLSGRHLAGAPLEAHLSEKQLRELTDSLPHLVWTCLAEGPCDYLSRQWLEYTGIPEAEQLGYGWLSQIHPGDRERVQTEWAGAVGRGAPFDIEFRIRRADGAHRWFRTRAIPLRDANERLVKWYGSNTDIDDYKSSEESLRMSEERLRLAQQAAHIGSFEWNVQTGANSWTPELEAMYGLSPGEFGTTQASWEALVHESDRAAALGHVQRAFETHLPVEGEWRILWRDGTVHWLVGRFQVFKDPAGNPHRLIGVNMDITERKRAEQEIRRLNENLERLVEARTAQLSVANRELEAFSYSVAHDLRAPLRGMNGFAKILLDEYSDRLDGEAITCLRQIYANAVRMGRLIDALLSLGRVARTELHPEWTDLSSLARSVASHLAVGEPARTVEITVEERLRARMDPALAQTLLENLIGNAWKFTSRSTGARIEFGTTETGDGRAFFVRDNGAGFNMDHSAKLFAPFQRLHTSRDFPGTGVGLATAHRIIERHHGRIWAHGSVGEGATFFFTLPDATEHSGQ